MRKLTEKEEKDYEIIKAGLFIIALLMLVVMLGNKSGCGEPVKNNNHYPHTEECAVHCSAIFGYGTAEAQECFNECNQP